MKTRKVMKKFVGVSAATLMLLSVGGGAVNATNGNVHADTFDDILDNASKQGPSKSDIAQEQMQYHYALKDAQEHPENMRDDESTLQYNSQYHKGTFEHQVEQATHQRVPSDNSAQEPARHKSSNQPAKPATHKAHKSSYNHDSSDDDVTPTKPKAKKKSASKSNDSNGVKTTKVAKKSHKNTKAPKRVRKAHKAKRNVKRADGNSIHKPTNKSVHRDSKGTHADVKRSGFIFNLMNAIHRMNNRINKIENIL